MRFLDAIFSKDRRFVFYLQRQTKGRIHPPSLLPSLGLTGVYWEPSKIQVTKDEFTIGKVELHGGKVSVLGQLPPPPTIGNYLYDLGGVIAGMSWSSKNMLECFVILTSPTMVMSGAREDNATSVVTDHWRPCETLEDQCLDLKPEQDDEQLDKFSSDLELVNTGESVFVLDSKSHTIPMLVGNPISVDKGFGYSRRDAFERSQQEAKLHHHMWMILTTEHGSGTGKW